MPTTLPTVVTDMTTSGLDLIIDLGMLTLGLIIAVSVVKYLRGTA